MYFAKGYFLSSRSDRNFAKSIQKLTGIYPNNVALYKQAFTHPFNSKVNYQRLEFLGDAVLNTVLTDIVFRKFPDLDEGLLTKIRANVVCNDALVRIARRMNLESYLQNTPPQQNKGKRFERDIVESLIGAVYLDKGYPCCRDFIAAKILTPFVDMDKLKNLELSYSTKKLSV